MASDVCAWFFPAIAKPPLVASATNRIFQSSV
jgi:hypothetical protein